MPKNLLILLGGIVAAGFIFTAGMFFFLSHGSIEAKGFCDFCHTAYYDPDEYAFNDKVKMEKPSGMLTGCAECHPQPYAEFKVSAHFETEKEEQRPGCTNCHEPHSIFVWAKYMYFSPIAWERLQVSLHDDTFWTEQVRPDLAAKARIKFVKDKSKLCKDCHLKNNNFKPEIKRHKAEIEVVKSVKNMNCIKCHFNLVHAEVDWDDKKEVLKKY